MTSISFFSLLPLYINFMRFLFTMFIPFYFMLSIIFENFSFDGHRHFSQTVSSSHCISAMEQ